MNGITDSLYESPNEDSLLAFVFCIAGVTDDTKSRLGYVFFHNSEQWRTILLTTQSVFHKTQRLRAFGWHIVFKFYKYAPAIPAITGVFKIKQIIRDIAQISNCFVAGITIYPAGIFLQQS